MLLLAREPRLRQPQGPFRPSAAWSDALLIWTPEHTAGRFHPPQIGDGSTNSPFAAVDTLGRGMLCPNDPTPTNQRLAFADIIPAAHLSMDRGLTCIAVCRVDGLRSPANDNTYLGIIQCATAGNASTGGVIFGMGTSSTLQTHWMMAAGNDTTLTWDNGTRSATSPPTAAGSFADGDLAIGIGVLEPGTKLIRFHLRNLTTRVDLFGSATSTITSFGATTSKLGLLAYHRSSVNVVRAYRQPVFLAGLLPRAISAAEASALLDSPFQVIAPRTRPTMIALSGAAAQLAGDAIASAQASAQLAASSVELAGDATAGAIASAELTVSAAPIVVDHDIDAGNLDPATIVVTDASTTTPTIQADYRVPAAGINWRHFLFAVDDAEGKRPYFDLQKADHYGSAAFTAAWKPLWTTDFVTWHQAAARTITSTRIQWQFAEDFPAGRIYVASHPLKQQAYCATFAAELLASYASVAAPAPSADASGVYATTPTENDDLGRAVGGNAQYAIKLAWGGATTDGLRKRKLVVLAGMHSAGEAHSWYGFESSVRWMLDDASAEAVAFRANWDVYLYFAVTPNGWEGGSQRRNFRSTQDPNRDWALTAASTLAEINNLRAAIEGDTGTAADVLFSWHGDASTAQRWNVYVMPPDDQAGTRTPTMAAFLAKGAPIFGVSPRLVTYTLTNTDMWWGKAKLGASLSVAVEMQALGDSSVAEAVMVGESWAKTLQATDAAGYFVGNLLEAAASGSAQAAGTLSAGAAELIGASVVAATATGSLSTGISLHGAAVSLALVEGTLTAQIRLQSSALAGAMAAAGLTTAIQLAAAAQGGASASGDLSTQSAGADLAGNAAAAALAAGSITAHIRFAASAVAQAIAQGALETGIALNGAALAAALSAGDIMTAIRMAADALAAGSASGALSTTPAGLSADATALALAEGGLTTAIRLQGAAASVVQATGTLDVAITFDAAAFAAAMASGVLSTQIRMGAAVVASALAVANLTGGLPMVPPAERTIPVRAQTRVIPVRAQTRVIPA